MNAIRLIVAIIALLISVYHSSGSINYYKPIVSVGFHNVDINLDGVDDYVVEGEIIIPYKFPPSVVFYLRSLNGNRYATLFNTWVYPFHESMAVCSNSMIGLTWDDTSQSEKGSFLGYGTNSLFTVGINYICIALKMEDGYHYGWIRVYYDLMGISIIDWAFESRPDYWIFTGEIPKSVRMRHPEKSNTNYIKLIWQAEIGKTYQIQYKDDLNYPWWTNLDFAVPAISQEMCIELPLDKNARFFRVIEAEPEIYPAPETLTPPKIIPFK